MGSREITSICQHVLSQPCSSLRSPQFDLPSLWQWPLPGALGKMGINGITMKFRNSLQKLYMDRLCMNLFRKDDIVCHLVVLWVLFQLSSCFVTCSSASLSCAASMIRADNHRFGVLKYDFEHLLAGSQYVYGNAGELPMNRVLSAALTLCAAVVKLRKCLIIVE